MLLGFPHSLLTGDKQRWRPGYHSAFRAFSINDHGPWVLQSGGPRPFATGQRLSWCGLSLEVHQEKVRSVCPSGMERSCDLKIHFGMTDVITSGWRGREGNTHLGIGHDTQVKDLTVSARETVFTRTPFRLQVVNETTGVCNLLHNYVTCQPFEP